MLAVPRPRNCKPHKVAWSKARTTLFYPNVTFRLFLHGGETFLLGKILPLLLQLVRALNLIACSVGSAEKELAGWLKSIANAGRINRRCTPLDFDDLRSACGSPTRGEFALNRVLKRLHLYRFIEVYSTRGLRLLMDADRSVFHR